VSAVEVFWRERNLPPRIEELVVAPQGLGFREGEMTPRSEAVTQTLPGGQKVEYSVSTTQARALRDLPAWLRGLRTMQWRGTDPNGDRLRFRVEVRREPGGEWIEVGKDLEASSFTWDTNGLPDGRYRVRVTGSDQIGNPVGEGLTTEVSSEPFSVDNTAPEIPSLEARAEGATIVVTGRAEDGASALTRLELSLDNDDWRTVSPDGGLADDRTLAVTVRLPGVAPGERTVSLRAVDLAGNSVTRAVRVVVPRAR
jgi:hypothetical protein